MDRPQQYRFHQGEKQLPFSSDEYDARLAGLRAIMREQGVDACVFTSMHNIAYYSGFYIAALAAPMDWLSRRQIASQSVQALMPRNPGGAVMGTTSPIPIGSVTITGARSKL